MQTTSTLKANDVIKNFQENARREILLSALDKTFHEKYAEELRYEKTYTDLKKFVQEIIGSISDSQQKRDAEVKLSETVRNTDDEEKFCRFLDRLQRISADASDDDTIRSYLVQRTFWKKYFIKKQGVST